MRCMPGIAAAAVYKGRQRGMERRRPGGIFAPNKIRLKYCHFLDALVRQACVIPFYLKPFGTGFPVTCNQES